MVATKFVVILHLVVLASCGKLESRSFLLDTLQQVGQNVQAVTNLTVNTLDSLEDLTGTVVEEAANLTSNTVDLLDDLTGTVVEEAANLTSNTVDSLDDLTGTVVEEAANLTSNTVDSLDDLTGTVVEEAANLTSNTVDSLVDLTGTVVEAAANLTSNTVDSLDDLTGTVVEGVVNETSEILGNLLGRSLILNTVEQQLQNLQDVGDLTLTSLENLLATVQEETAHITSDLSSQLDSIVGNLTNEINDIAASALAAGADPTACVGDSINRITSLSGSLLGNATGCLFAQYDAVKLAVGGVAQLVESANNIAADIQVRIATCKSNTITLLQDLCLLQVEATVNIAGLVTGITTKAAEVTTLATSTIGSLAKCTLGLAASLTDQGNDIVQSVLGCVNNLL